MGKRCRITHFQFKNTEVGGLENRIVDKGLALYVADLG